MKVASVIQSPGLLPGKAKGAAAVEGSSFGDLLAAHIEAIGAQEALSLLAGGKVEAESLLQALEKALSAGDLKGLQALCEALIASKDEAGENGAAKIMELFSALKEAAKDSRGLPGSNPGWARGLPLAEGTEDAGNAAGSDRRGSLSQIVHQILKLATGGSEDSKPLSTSDPLSTAHQSDAWKPTSNSGQGKEPPVLSNAQTAESLPFQAAMTGRVQSERAAALNAMANHSTALKPGSQAFASPGEVQSAVQPELGLEMHDEIPVFQQGGKGNSPAGLLRSAVGMSETSQFHFILRNTVTQGGHHTMNLKLSPPDLGPLHMKVQVGGEEIKALFVTEAMGQKMVLDRGLPSLRQGLADQGFSVQDLEVQVGTDSGGAPSHQPARKDMVPGFRSMLGEADDDSTDESMDRAPSVRANGGRQHILDVMI